MNPSPRIGMTTIDGTLTAWAQFTGKRRAVATQLNQLATRLRTAETIGAEESGQLGLSQTIREVEQTAEGLEKGVYRLMVMGDMKRGKSTLLNALIGETLLPSDVNPCTALLTTLRYGPEKRVILHYKNGRKDGREPEAVSLETFQQTYVISPTESKRLAEQEKEAFPDISHVVVEYPLPLLQQGIELIDTPGLNDTEARNEQVLDYLKDCQAVLFVLNATQPFTLDEQRYLNNYLKDAGLALFFIVNGWDRIRSGLLDPEDTAAVASAEANVRDVFSTNLKDYAPAGRPLRLFEISALQALRQRLADTSLSGSGLPKLLTDLDHFLAYERGPAELHRAQNVASRAYRSASTSIARRIPLLDETLETLEAKVASVQGDFSQLEGIRDRYRNVIHTSRDINIQTVSDSFKTYILNLEKTFEADFANSQPDLHFLDFLEADKRQEFYTAFKRAFERYLNDRLAVWEVEAKETIGKAIDELNASAAEYQVAYAEIVQVIHDKVVGHRVYGVGDRYDAEKNKIWADSVKDIFEEIPSNMNNAVRSFNGFWRAVMQSAVASIVVLLVTQLVGVVFSTIFLNIIGVIAAAGGIFAVQAEFMRQTFLQATKKEFVKQLPDIAEKQTPNIRKAVYDCFSAYEERAIDRIGSDIESRKSELTNLVAQKQQREINREQEIARLQQLESHIQENLSEIESEVNRSLK